MDAHAAVTESAADAVYVDAKRKEEKYDFLKSL